MNQTSKFLLIGFVRYQILVLYMVMFISGVLLWMIVLIDVGYTAFSSTGAGFITSRVSKASWSGLVLLARVLRRQRWLKFSGPIVIVITLMQWIALLWTAHVLVVASDNNSILNSQTKLPASLVEKIYVTGYTLTTMGNGDFIGGSENWKLYIALAAFSGIAVVSLALTYLVQVLSNVTTKKEFSSAVSGLGRTPEELLLNAWNGNDFSALNPHLLQFSKQISSISESHLSYPVLHFYYSPDPKKSLPIATAVFDEALTILYERIPQDRWPDRLILQAARNAVTSFLNTLKNSFIKPAKAAPSFPKLDAFQAAGVPLKKTWNSEEANELTERRKLLLAFVKDEGRAWSVVQNQKTPQRVQ